MTRSNPYAAKKSAGVPDVLGTVEESVPAGTINEVLDWVGEDESRARLALRSEEDGNQRVTLMDKLRGLLDG